MKTLAYRNFDTLEGVLAVTSCGLGVVNWVLCKRVTAAEPAKMLGMAISIVWAAASYIYLGLHSLIYKLRRDKKGAVAVSLPMDSKN